MSLLRRAAELAEEHLPSLPSSPVGASTGYEDVVAALDEPLPESGEDPLDVIERLAPPSGRRRSPAPARATSASSPAARCRRRWRPTGCVSAWDQNAFSLVSSPAAAAVEAVTERWVLEALGLPGAPGSASHDGRHDGQLHLHPRRPPRACSRVRAGTSRRRADRRAADPARGRRARPRLDARRAPLRRARPGAPSACPRQGACDRRARARAHRRADHRLRPGRRGQHRRLRPARGDRRRREGARRLAARRRRLRAVGGGQPRACATSSRAPSAPTRGRSTPTSGSTCPTTAGSRSSPTAPR